MIALIWDLVPRLDIQVSPVRRGRNTLPAKLEGQIGKRRSEKNEDHDAKKSSKQRRQEPDPQGLPCLSLLRHGIPIQGGHDCLRGTGDPEEDGRNLASVDTPAIDPCEEDEGL